MAGTPPGQRRLTAALQAGPNLCLRLRERCDNKCDGGPRAASCRSPEPPTRAPAVLIRSRTDRFRWRSGGSTPIVASTPYCDALLRPGGFGVEL